MVLVTAAFGSQVSGHDGQHSCFTRTLGCSSALGGGQAPTMCVRGYNDAVSNQVGAVRDCRAPLKGM